ncbi:NADP-dependent oxidoreductase [Microlunatus capsulatus]|uniref:NADPH:quinone reductase-like Zn-dependent oxidoreductase n=1 Tax=Microlunatus capsulatus TaxID=99117 RepID=A0ABS4ZCY8_9ACTN|nr:NADP-dependent oxidoreductase [Microlunatus capsulatus]MBP2418897.1 NADPH:quinone reductase-like Zn-dependent oxidoreductase [Microlunatus capsulatus]
MKAVQFEEFGGPEVLHIVDREVPQPGPGQVRVRVQAAGVNPLDGKIRSGALQALFPTTLPVVPGFELAGVVDAVGEEVEELSVGDEVFGWSDTGAYAEFALVTAMAVKPSGLDWASAAALPVASEAAERVLDLLGIKAGETLLVHGASGAVGTLAVQLAVERGARVVGTAGPDNLDRVAGLGATATTYGPGLVDRVRALAPEGVDAVFDVAGKGALEDSIALRGSTDRIITIADFRARELGITFASGPGQRSAVRLGAVGRAVAAGDISVVVTTYPLERAVEAQQLSDGGHSRGKLILLVS